MQINNVQATSFGAIKIPVNSQERVMSALKYECTTLDLAKCLQVLKKELKNPNHIHLRDVGYIGGMECVGHWEAFVNGNEYCNIPGLLLNYTPPKFFAKLSKLAGKYLDKPQQLERKAQDILNQKKILEFTERLKKGCEEDFRDSLLAEIQKYIKLGLEK